MPDLGDGGRHVARVTYSPRLSAEAAMSPAFRASPHLASLVYPRGAAWRHGLGTLSVWVDALGGPPALVVPLSLETLLPAMVTAGTATIGFTAATGAALQAHELLSWAFWADTDPSAELAATAGLRPAAITCVSRAAGALTAATHAPGAMQGGCHVAGRDGGAMGACSAVVGVSFCLFGRSVCAAFRACRRTRHMRACTCVRRLRRRARA